MNLPKFCYIVFGIWIMKLKWNTFNFNFSEGQIYVIWQNFASTSSFRHFKGMESKLVNTHNVSESKMICYFISFIQMMLWVFLKSSSRRENLSITRKNLCYRKKHLKLECFPALAQILILKKRGQNVGILFTKLINLIEATPNICS